jgi:DnaJ-class molecular chaperone
MDVCIWCHGQGKINEGTTFEHFCTHCNGLGERPKDTINKIVEGFEDKITKLTEENQQLQARIKQLEEQLFDKYKTEEHEN